MLTTFFSQRTCRACGRELGRQRHWCPTCNRDNPSLKSQLIMLSVVLFGFSTFCAVVYYSAAHTLN